MIDFSEVNTPEEWELFARDFLQLTGFYVESQPDRGADGGKDMIVTEDLKGYLGNYKFRWLVSCKHYSKSKQSINEEIERNLLERIVGFKADGFIGFYSTLPSSGLNNRLEQFRQNIQIKDYRIFDYKMIENYMLRMGYSELLQRYFPVSYKTVKPIHLLTSEYIPIECEKCGKDLLKEMYVTGYSGLISYVYKQIEGKEYKEEIIDVYCACKTDSCDSVLEKQYWQNGEYLTSWEDLSDLVIPSWYLRNIFSVMNRIKDGEIVFSDVAYKNFKKYMVALAQKTFRELNEEERARVSSLLEISF